MALKLILIFFCSFLTNFSNAQLCSDLFSTQSITVVSLSSENRLAWVLPILEKYVMEHAKPSVKDYLLRDIQNGSLQLKLDHSGRIVGFGIYTRWGLLPLSEYSRIIDGFQNGDEAFFKEILADVSISSDSSSSRPIGRKKTKDLDWYDNLPDQDYPYQGRFGIYYDTLD